MKSARHVQLRYIAVLLSLALLASCARTEKNAGAAINAQPCASPTRIASMAPASTRILAKLGLADKLVAVDTWSADIKGVPAAAVRFDMMHPDVERLAALDCDLIVVSEMTKQGTSQDPFKPLAAAGARVEYFPTATSLAGIRADVTHLATLTGTETEGQKINADMDAEIARIEKIAQKIPAKERRTVVFELSSAPDIYSFGKGVYLNELIEKAGAINALGDETGWISVSAETVVAANPDVILTNVTGIDNPVKEIAKRPGWSGMKAVKHRKIFRIDAATSSQPSPDVVLALRQIAEAVYPEYFE
jgi:iron complex transport system substrate-binding protein